MIALDARIGAAEIVHSGPELVEAYFERIVLVSVMLWRSVTTMLTDGWLPRRSDWVSRSSPTTVFSKMFQVS